MSATPPLVPSQLAARIDTSQVSDIRYWTRTLGVTPNDLCLAVAAVGDIPADVRAEIRRRRRLFTPGRI
ncbi:DUF3606 domain-containing protein [Luteibacter anthropi]|uniref:DUF3606 domain-containing protein n=1 Tax=Luteibacter anthropi TaxID=564369 RepID=UPI00203264F7|nr:DUF3606 domain-containing protein [Luteibacter anthropi]URX61745.1 DUF3606 domain-containing protein [Luteibacter anthropi]